jgi:hypothetical protein
VQKLPEQVRFGVLLVRHCVVLVLYAFMRPVPVLGGMNFVAKLFCITTARTNLNLVRFIVVYFAIVVQLALHKLMADVECFFDLRCLADLVVTAGLNRLVDS